MHSENESPCLPRIGLGTVQFGIDYGISNSEGRTPPEEVAKILFEANSAGITLLDTAPAYGESERVLGSFPLREMGFKVVTKTLVQDQAPKGSRDLGLAEGLKASLAKLGIPQAYGLLFHRSSELEGMHGSDLVAEARECQQRGWVEKIGVTVYTAEEIDRVMDSLQPELIQIPLNVFDQRLMRSGHLEALKASGVEIHVRSVFLQGLLLMEPESLPPKLSGARAPLERFRAFARNHSRTPLEAALGFVLGLSGVDTVLCGVNSSGQLQDICKGAVPFRAEELADFALDDAIVLNPSVWGATK